MAVCALSDAASHYTPHGFAEARRYVVEDLLNTLPARSLADLRARLSWMEWWNLHETTPDVREDRVRLATLRGDVERMGQRIREQDVHTVNTPGAPRDGSDLSHAEGHYTTASPSRPPNPASPSAGVQNGRGEVSSTHPILECSSAPAGGLVSRNDAPFVQSGQAEGCSRGEHPLRRTNADKRRDVLALLNAESSGIAPLTDREIARRAGVSPTTVGTIRRSMQ